MNKHILRQVVTVVVMAATIVVNILANALPLNGQNTGEISDRFASTLCPPAMSFRSGG
jgi:hypothetical protein